MAKLELTPDEESVLKKAKQAADTHTELHLTGEEAKVAAKLNLDAHHAWGPHPHGPYEPRPWSGPPWPRPWGPGPYVRGYHDGNDFILGGITEAGLMVLDHWLNPGPEVVEVPAEPPASQAPVTVNVNVPPAGGGGGVTAGDLRNAETDPRPDVKLKGREQALGPKESELAPPKKGKSKGKKK